MAQMHDHVLNIIKGDHLHAVDKSVRVFDDTAFSAGMVGSLEADTGFVQVGLTEDAMPMFLYWNSGDFDVMVHRDPASPLYQEVEGSFVGAGTGTEYKADGDNPEGFAADSIAVVRCLPACGAFELGSTEFDADQTYNANQPLTSAAPGDPVGDPGVLIPGEYWVNTICGVVSEPHNEVSTSKTPYRKDELRFWPVFIPHIDVDADLFSVFERI